LSLDLCLTAAAKVLFYALGKQNQIVLIYWTPLAGFTDTNQDLLAAERLCRPASLNNVKECNLLSGKPLATLRAFTATADCCAFFNRARVNYAGIFESTEWAIHLGVSSLQYSYLARSRCIERTSKLTLKPPLMEVFAGLTPTCSSNYKAFLEALPDKRVRGFLAACRKNHR
jgi:hypothetical protein